MNTNGIEQFASDNYAGMCTPVVDYLDRANRGFSQAYGGDDQSRQAADAIRALFETDCEVFFVFTGTAANGLAVAAMCQPFNSVICHRVSHINTEEVGAPEFLSGGAKMIGVDGDAARFRPAAVDAVMAGVEEFVTAKPRAVSLTQASEFGTVYSIDEIGAMARTAHCHDLLLHMDGARFANACAWLDASPAELTWKQGVDVLSFGGSKNGMGLGEAVVFFNRELARDFGYRVKQAGQVASKMRFIAAQWLGLVESGAWLDNALHANACARRLADRLAALPWIKPLFPVEANSVFVEMPPEVCRAIREAGYSLYSFATPDGVRFMCSWATTVAGIDRLVTDLQKAAATAG